MTEKFESIIEGINPEKDFGILNSELFHIVNKIDDLSQKELIKKIEKDPNVVFRILKTVNSPYCLLNSKVNSINHAIIYLGRSEVKRIVLLASLIDISEKLSLTNIESINYIDFSTKVAEVSKKIVEHFDSSTIYYADDGYMAGLMISLGKLLLKSHYSDEILNINDFWVSIDIEKDNEKFDTNFIEISSYFLKKFHLEHIVEGYDHIFDENTDNFLSRVLKLSLNIVSINSRDEDVVDVLEKKDLLVDNFYDLGSGITVSKILIEDLVSLLKKI